MKFRPIVSLLLCGAALASYQFFHAHAANNRALTPIHDIQGDGPLSPFAGQTVMTSGIVTALRSNGFFLQAPDAEADADSNTSEAIFVFTGAALPAAAARGNRVNVTGQVIEFRPATDPVSPPVTEFSNNPTVELVSTGNAFPAPVTLQPADTRADGGLEQLERFEAMRVTLPSFTVVAPTDGTVNETNATATTNGIFFGVLTGIARPYREPGVELPNTLPPNPPANVPRFDANPERIRVDSDAQTGAAALEVVTGQVINNLTGVLDYGARSYTLLPDPGPRQISGESRAVPVPTLNSSEFTVAAWNLERFFDTVNDPSVSEPVLTAAAFQNRLNKASLAIRNILRAPDILGIEEMENLTTLQTLAQKINADAVAANQPNPQYAAYLVEGNDVGGIDVGFLVKTANVTQDKPRVSVLSVTQEGKATQITNPNTGAQSALNDRPPLILRAVVNHADGRSFPITVIANHLRSLNDIDNTDVQGTGTVGAFVRAKRRAQAEFLARLIQARQTADPTERIIAIGDFNAFEFNDGFVDVIGTIKGTPAPADQVYAASDDLVTPDLIDLLAYAPPGLNYSYVFNGNAQTIDHELITQNLSTRFSRIAYAHLDADFPETFRNDATRPERLSDHDAAVAYFNFGQPVSPDAGSVLLFPVYTSSIASPQLQNTRFSLTNTDVGRAVNVHLFFVDGTTGHAADAFVCLPPHRTISFFASDVDPGVNGFVVAVAVDERGCPRSFNFLAGEAYVKFASGHAANLVAGSVTALDDVAICEGTTATLRFDGHSYGALPRVLALSNFASRADGNDPLLFIDRIGGNLTDTAESAGMLFGILYDDAETPYSFTLAGGQQVRWNFSFFSRDPRITQIVPAGRTGWLKIYNFTQDVALLGTFINFTAQREIGSFSSGHNLHALSLTTSATLTIPVFPPNC